MKCGACNYLYEEEWNREDSEMVIKEGDDEFITIHGVFLVDNSGWHKGKHEVYLFACPKCGTIRIED